MKKNSLFLFLVLLLQGSVSSAFEYPKLFFSYAGVFDRQCASLTKFNIKEEWQNEAIERNLEFQKAWDEQSAILFGTLFNEVGKGFSKKELSVATSVCNFKSTSNPLLITVKRWLKSVTEPHQPEPMYGFVDFVFHEFLHNYVLENLKKPSPLLQKYRNEDQSVRAHIHLMALQKHVYTKLGRTETLKWVESFYLKVGGAYSRSWEIVGLEGTESFLSEMRR